MSVYCHLILNYPLALKTPLSLMMNDIKTSVIVIGTKIHKNVTLNTFF